MSAGLRVVRGVLLLVLVVFGAPLASGARVGAAVAGDADPPPMTVSVTPDRVTVRYGERASMTVTVTNTGTVSLFDLRVLDCEVSQVFPLLPGGSVAVPCEVGPFSPAGRDFTVTATAYADGRFVRADAPFRVTVLPPVGTIDVDYLLGGAELDAQQIVARPLGTSLELAAKVTNTGPVPLRDVTVTDFEQGSIACPSANLEVGASMVCGPWTVAVDRVGVVLDIVAVIGFDTDDAPASWADAIRWRGLDPTPACSATSTLLQGLDVRREGGPASSTLTGLRVLQGDTLVVRWAGWEPGRDGCRISLAQYGGAAVTFDPAVEQRLLAAASCAGATCRASNGAGYELRLVVQEVDGPVQFDLVTGPPLGSVGPVGGYYSGWLNGGTHRLIDAATLLPS